MICTVFNDPSFTGALLGAIITGLIAILVFQLGKLYEDNNREKLINNYIGLIKKVHEKTQGDFQIFVDAKKNNTNLPADYKAKVVQLINRGKILNEIDVNGLIEVSDNALYILEFIISYREATKLIATTHANYGNIFFDKSSGDGNKSEVEWLEEYIDIMKETITKIE